MLSQLRAFASDQSGSTAIGYGLMVGFISLAGFTVFQQLGSELRDSFFATSLDIKNALR